MIHKASKLITKTFDQKSLKYRMNEMKDASVVEAGFAIPNGPSAMVRFISKDEQNDAAVRVIRIISVDPAKKAAALEAINKCNQEFRGVKFVLDQDNDLNAEMDLPSGLKDEAVGPIAYNCFSTCMMAVQKAFPEIMRAILF